jgi:cytochrome c biogenesis protein CcdA
MSIGLIILSFVAGALTVLAPCILPLLPVIIGGSSLNTDDKEENGLKHAIVICISLAVSVLVFSLLLKASTLLLGIPQFAWQAISGIIVILFGINLIFPMLWAKISIKLGIENKSNRFLGQSSKKKGIMRDILIGAALGPVFASCSPTYALIVATILPQSFVNGFIYLTVYCLGLASVLLAIGVAGQSVVKKLGWAANPNGWFRKTLGIIFVITGLIVIFGLDKQIQTLIIESGLYDPIKRFEQRLR